MNFPQYIMLTLLLSLVPSIAWFFRWLLAERYTFLFKDDFKGAVCPYVMVRLDKLTGAVHGFNWAGWIKVKPHSDYPGTETPK